MRKTKAEFLNKVLKRQFISIPYLKSARTDQRRAVIVACSTISLIVQTGNAIAIFAGQAAV